MQARLLNQPGSSWAYGLFIESGGNSAFVKSLARSLRPQAYIAEPSVNEPEDFAVDARKVPQLLRLFGIRYVLSLDGSPTEAIGTWALGAKTQYYHLQDRGEVPLAEVSVWPLRAVRADWGPSVLAWWKAPGELAALPYDARDGEVLAAGGGLQSATVDVGKWSDRRIELTIVGSGVVPVLVKSTYAPGWHATGPDGKLLHVWRAAPDMMLIESGPGRVVFDYR
jgi:hypothetical protein